MPTRIAGIVLGMFVALIVLGLIVIVAIRKWCRTRNAGLDNQVSPAPRHSSPATDVTAADPKQHTAPSTERRLSIVSSSSEHSNDEVRLKLPSRNNSPSPYPASNRNPVLHAYPPPMPIPPPLHNPPPSYRFTTVLDPSKMMNHSPIPYPPATRQLPPLQRLPSMPKLPPIVNAPSVYNVPQVNNPTFSDDPVLVTHSTSEVWRHEWTLWKGSG